MGVMFLLKTITLAVFIIKFVESSDIEINAAIDACCKVGSKYVEQNKNPKCSIFNEKASHFNRSAGNLSFSSELNHLCYLTMEGCCLDKQRALECEKGIECAKSTADCSRLDKNVFFKSCYTACKIGEEKAKTFGKCNVDNDTETERIMLDCCEKFQEGEDEPEDPSESEETEMRDEEREETEACGNGYQMNSENKCVKTSANQCDSGFKMDFKSSNCRDVDECNEKPRICSQKCVNSYGSFFCTCNSGFKLESDKKTCIDIDECKDSDGIRCHGGGTCENTIGSFECICPPGLRDDGNRYCLDINECKESKHNCKSGEICLNIKGSYRCIEKETKCDIGYHHGAGGICYLTNRQKSRKANGEAKIPLNYHVLYQTLSANVHVSGKGLVLAQIPISVGSKAVINKLKVTYTGNGTKHAVKSLFRLEELNNILKVKLMKSLEGPQELELDIWINTRANSITAVRIIILVSEFPA